MLNRRRWFVGVLATLIAGTSLICFAQSKDSGKKKVLVYTQSLGFRHSVVARPLTGELSFAEKHLKKMLTKAGYEVYVTQDFHDLHGDAIKRYDALIMYTTGSDLPIDKNKLMEWLKNGGALIGVHSATDTFQSWPEWKKIMGGYFKTHGGASEKITIEIEDRDHPATVDVPRDWRIADEIYQLKDFDKSNVNMLLSVKLDAMSDDELKHHKMEKDKYYPIAYSNTVEKGRIFYTSLGHREDVWENEIYQKHLLGGIKWAMRDAKER